MASSKYPSVDQARECFDVVDNNLVWRPREGKDSKRFNSRYAGKVAGCLSNLGYKVVTWNKNSMLMQHLIIFAIRNGRYPENSLDHADRDRAVNSEDNLREATHSQNMSNRKGFGKYAKGVSYQKGRRKPWYAAIRVNKKAIHLGAFHTEAEASSAYQKAATAHFGEFTCFNRKEG